MVAGLVPQIQLDLVQPADGVLELLLVLESLGGEVDSVLEAMRVLIFSLYYLAARELGFQLQVDCALGLGETLEDALPRGRNEGFSHPLLKVVDEQPHPLVGALVESQPHSLAVDYLCEH